MFKGSRGRRSEASGSQNSFSRIMDLADQTLWVLCFCTFIEVSLPRSIYNSSHLKCTVIGEGMQTLKNGVCQVAGGLSWIPYNPNCFIGSHCLPIFISRIQDQTVAAVHGHQDGTSLVLNYCHKIDLIIQNLSVINWS